MNPLRSFQSLKRKLSGILLLVSLLCSAQNHDFGAAYFSNLSTSDGLPSNIIACIAQDTYDFIWIGTGSGLARYDGYNFKIFKRTESANSLPSNELSTLLVEGDWLWVGTWQGLCKIHTRTFEVIRVDLGNTGPIRVLHKGKNGILWIGTGNGLIRYIIQDGTYTLYSASNSQLSHNTIRCIYEEPVGTLWVGTYDGLNRSEKGDPEFVRIRLTRTGTEPSKNHLILDIKPGATNSLWVGTESGLYTLNEQTFDAKLLHPEGGFSNEVIKCVYKNGGDKLWLGTDFGLNLFNPITRENTVFFHDPQVPYSIPNNVIWQIFEDRSGLIWLVTSNGLSRINKAESFYQYVEVTDTAVNQRTGNQIKSILIDQNDTYWLGTLHGVVSTNPKTRARRVFDTETKSTERILLNNVFALEQDYENNIWIGTAGGINIWDGRVMHEITANPRNGLTSNYIARFVKGPEKTLWAGAWEGGIFKIQGSYPEVTFQKVQDLNGSEKFGAGPSSLWAIEFDELYEIDPGTLMKRHIPEFSTASGKQMIYCLYVSKAGEVWAGSLNGLVRYNPTINQASFHSLKTGNDLNVSSIMEDQSGNIWSASNSSIQKIGLDSAIAFFPLDKGLPIKTFYYGCAARSGNGDILFGGDNGYLTFSPDMAVPNKFEPLVYITSILINNKQINVGESLDNEVVLNTEDIAFTDALELDYGRRSLTLEFSSLHFWQPAMNLYSYRLEGLDKNWNQVSGMKNFAVYSSLPSGTYTFQVKATNNYGIESPDIATLKIRIKPPLYFSPLFIFIYVAVLGALIFYGLQFYTTRVHLKNELRITRMEKEHAEEIERTKEQFFTNISHELRTPISLILPPLHEIQKTGKLDFHDQKLIALAEKNSNRLLRLVDQILDFNKIEHESLDLEIQQMEIVGFTHEIVQLFADQASRHRITLEFHSDPERLDAWLDQKKIETVLFNLLSNAFKFTPDSGIISVFVKKNGENQFSIEVQDSGLGIPEGEKSRIFERFYQTESGKRISSSSGIGLTLSREYVSLHKGTIAVQSEPGQGTRFTVSLPIKGQEYSFARQSTFTRPGRKMTAESQPLKSGSQKPKILLVEDNDDIVDFIRVSLEGKYAFEVASNGEEGLAKAKAVMPELIISDIMMPVMDGLRMTETIKSAAETSHIMVILLTAKALPSNQLEGIKRGADIYLTKPFEIELLDAHITNLLRRKDELNTYFRNLLVSNAGETDVRNNQDNKFLKKVMDIIEANMGESEFGVEEIAGEMAMSPTHLYRKLKAITSHSPMEILKKYRVKKASLLLANNEGNVSEVMYKVGFSSLSYFSKCFREEFGCTPKEYQGHSKE